jgi:LacI family transcriptional regulator
MAMGALGAADEMGLRVPEELSVMGYDDQELARHTRPPLSTVVLPNYEMGRKAAELLIDLAIHAKAMRPATFEIDGPLVERYSVADCPGR